MKLYLYVFNLKRYGNITQQVKQYFFSCSSESVLSTKSALFKLGQQAAAYPLLLLSLIQMNGHSASSIFISHLVHCHFTQLLPSQNIQTGKMWDTVFAFVLDPE